MENAFKFPNLFFHFQQICSLLYTFKKYMFAIYFQKIDGAMPAKCHLIFPHVCDIHVAHNISVIYIAPNTLFHLQFDAIFHNFLSNLIGRHCAVHL
jgi:hypothetical protein